MPRQRPRRRRRPTDTAPAYDAPPQSTIERAPEPRGRRLLPTAGIVTALGLGIWVGWTFTNVGELAENIVLWAGVLMAGLGGGRLFRRAIQSRRDRDR